MRLVYLESPYAGDVALNVAYARAAMKDSLSRGEAPFASHLLYTQPGILDDEIPEERARGMEAGFQWAGRATATIVYTDLGISPGMEAGVRRALSEGRPVVYRSIGFAAPGRLKPFCRACQAIPAYGYCNLKGCPMPTPAAAQGNERRERAP